MERAPIGLTWDRGYDRDGCNLTPLLFNLFLEAMLMVAFNEFRKDNEEVMANMVKVKRVVTEVKGNNAKLVEAVRSIWGMLYANDASIVSTPPGSLERMMTIIARVSGRFGLLVSKPKDGDHVRARQRDE